MPVKVTERFLRKTYTRDGLSTWAIEKKYGVTRSRVFTLLKRYGIPTRSIAQAHIRYKRVSFNGNRGEQAYLIGFATGDLRVRNHNGNRSETISIGCGSTKKAQIDLIQRLFSTYGRVWQGKPDSRGAVNIEAFVNKSFSFLLPSERNYSWCNKNNEHFFSFVAGFTDAEGSLFLSQGKGFLAWGNYDDKILSFIRNGLIQYGIAVPNISRDNLQGTRGTHGYLRNGTYYHVSISRKTELKKALDMIEPYILHSDKKKKLAVVRKNLMLRGVT